MEKAPLSLDPDPVAPPKNGRAGASLLDSLERGVQRINLLGGQIDLIEPAQVLAHLHDCVVSKRRSVIGNHNLHSLYLLPRTSGMQGLYDRAEIVQLDSTPLIWFGRWLKLPVEARHRSTYLDWRDRFWAMANTEGWRVLYLGGAPGVAAKGAESLMSRYPHVVIEGLSGFFDATTGSLGNQAVLGAIKMFEPDVVMVGMGMPRQEIWIADNYPALPSCPILPVGAAFDYEAGVQKAAPRWMGRLGLEWLFRLVSDPRRLFT